VGWLVRALQQVEVPDATHVRFDGVADARVAQPCAEHWKCLVEYERSIPHAVEVGDDGQESDEVELVPVVLQLRRCCEGAVY
jgi:hypothetical protein